MGLITLVGCNQTKTTGTLKNLKEGITGETNASANYAAFAEQAIAEGYNNIAVFLKAA